MKKIFKKFSVFMLSLMTAVLACAGLSACSETGGNGKPNTDNGNKQTSGSLYGKWNEYDGVRLAFMDEQIYNDGEFDGSKVLPELDCKLGVKYYMVADFDIQAPQDNDGRESVIAEVKIQPASAVSATVQETQSGNVSEETKDDITTLRATYKIPESAETVRKMRLTVQFVAKAQNLAELELSFKCDGDLQAVKTEKIEKSATMGYSDGLAYELDPLDGEFYTVVGIESYGDTALLMPNIHEGEYVECLWHKSESNSANIANRKIKSLLIPASVELVDAENFKTYFLYLENISVAKNNEVYASKDGILYDKSLNSILFVPCNIKGVAEIPDGVTKINDGAFTSRSGLTAVTIPNSVTDIGKNAFSYCSGLTEIIIPNGVISIGESAFFECSGLTDVTIPSSVTSIGGRAFGSCKNLKDIIYGGSKGKWKNGIVKERDRYGCEWDSETGNYTLHCIDGDLTRAEA